MRVLSAVVLVAMGAAIAALGRYGWSHGDALIPHTTAESQVPHRRAVLRRGAVSCMVAGSLMVVIAVIAAVN